MSDVGKLLIGAGVVLIVAGLALWGLGRAGFQGLPGDVVYESDDLRVYFPWVSMLVLSILLSALLWLIQWIGGR